MRRSAAAALLLAFASLAACTPKVLLGGYLQYVPNGVQYDIYQPNMDRNDIVRLRAQHADNGYCDTGLKADYVASALALPGIAGTEYQCSRAIVQNAARDKDAGFAVAEFNFETGFGIVEDNADPVAAIRRASDAAHAAGLKFRCTPDRQLTKTYASRFAPYCDYYHIQAQALQPDGVQVYSDFVHDTVAKLEAARPALQGHITVQVSPSRGAPSGKDVQQHMRDCVAAVMDVADGASLWFGNDRLDDLRAFVEWFHQTY